MKRFPKRLIGYARDRSGGLSLGLGLGIPMTRGVPGGGGGGSLALAPDGDTGPVSEDDFDRADSGAVGNGWVEAGGDFQVLSNALFCDTVGDWIEQQGAAGGAMFLQARIQAGESGARPLLIARGTYNGGGTNRQGYGLLINPAGDLLVIQRTVNGTDTNIASAALTVDAGVYYDVQLYVADGVQQGWGGGVSVNAADTSHDGQNDRFPGFRCNVSSPAKEHAFDDFAWTPSPFIVVSGLADGQKAKVVNASEEVVATATESGGTATIDCSRFGGATEIVPIGGWEALIVTDADDVELARYDGAGIYPGYAYTAS